MSHITIFVNSLPRPRKLLLYQTQQAAVDRVPALRQVYFHKWICVRSRFTGPLRVTMATPDWETTPVRLPIAVRHQEGGVSCLLTVVSVYTHTDNTPARRHVEDRQRQLIIVIAPIRGPLTMGGPHTVVGVVTLIQLFLYTTSFLRTRSRP